jgi:hypothetical protein
MTAHGGPFDVTLDFGFRATQEDEPNWEARITMSWEHAISVVRILERVIRDYERQVPSLATIRVKLAEAEQEETTAQEKK